MLTSLLLLLAPALACGHADQYRLVPLGQVGDTLIALELDQLRRDREDAEGLALYWIVTPKLISISSEATELKAYTAVEVDDKRYAEGLSGTLRQAQQDAAALDGFAPLSPTSHEDCGYFPVCTGLSDPRSAGSVWTDASRYAAHEGAPGGAPDMQDWRLGGVRRYEGLAVVTVGAGPHFDQYPKDPHKAAPREAAALSHEGVPHHGISIDVIVR